LPDKNESDIDIFVFCEAVPGVSARRAAIESAGINTDEIHLSGERGRFWGVCDFLTAGGAEFCLMYFALDEMDQEIESVLDGARMDREDEYFYPTGRCATFLGMHVLYDRAGYIAGMKKRLAAYPPPLAEKTFSHHINFIDDAEDFARAVQRGDALFFHSTLEKALDHYLLALFALNRCFFPSRKRNLQAIDSFARKPADCSERLLEVVALGAKPETLEKSYELWSALCKELSEL